MDEEEAAAEEKALAMVGAVPVECSWHTARKRPVPPTLAPIK
jgi:hypothetical protein